MNMNSGKEVAKYGDSVDIVSCRSSLSTIESRMSSVKFLRLWALNRNNIGQVPMDRGGQ